MNNDVLDIALSRRSMLTGLVLAAALAPSVVAAEGGLKGSSTEEPGSRPDDALAEIGVTGDGAYESPLFGYQVAWDETWFVPPDDPGTTSAADTWDTLRLRWADTPDAADVGAMVSFDGFGGPGMDISGWLEGMADADTLDEYFGLGVYTSAVALVAQDGDVQEVVWRLTGLDDPNDVVAMISSYRTLADDLMLMTTLSVFVQPLLGASLEGLIEGVTIDGEPVLSLLTQTEIEDALASLD